MDQKVAGGFVELSAKGLTSVEDALKRLRTLVAGLDADGKKSLATGFASSAGSQFQSTAVGIGAAAVAMGAFNTQAGRFARTPRQGAALEDLVKQMGEMKGRALRGPAGMGPVVELTPVVEVLDVTKKKLAETSASWGASSKAGGYATRQWEDVLRRMGETKGLKGFIAGMKPIPEAIAVTKKKVDALKVSWEQVGAAAKSVGRYAGLALAGSVAAMSKFAEAASPLEWDRLRLAIFRVQIQLGRILLPLLREVTGWLNSLAEKIRGMTNEQRQSALEWAKFALKVLAAVFVVSRLIPLLLLVNKLGVAMGLISLGPFIAALVAVAALLGLIAYRMKDFADKKSDLADSFTGRHVTRQQFESSPIRAEVLDMAKRMRAEGKSDAEISEALRKIQKEGLDREVDLAKKAQGTTSDSIAHYARLIGLGPFGPELADAVNRALGISTAADRQEAARVAGQKQRDDNEILERSRNEVFGRKQPAFKGDEFTGLLRPEKQQFHGLSDFAQRIQEGALGEDLQKQMLEAVRNQTDAVNQNGANTVQAIRDGKQAPEIRR